MHSDKLRNYLNIFMHFNSESRQQFNNWLNCIEFFPRLINMQIAVLYSAVELTTVENKSFK